MDEVKKLSAKKDLSLTDLYAYSDRKETEQGFAYYAFSYDGVEYTLDIYTTEQGELKGVRLVRRSDYLSIDIRNGKIICLHRKSLLQIILPWNSRRKWR